MPSTTKTLEQQADRYAGTSFQPRNRSFASACEFLGLKPNLSRERLVEKGYLRKVASIIGNRYWYVTNPRAKGLLYFQEKGYTPKGSDKEYSSTKIFVTPDGINLMAEICGDLITKPKKQAK